MRWGAPFDNDLDRVITETRKAEALEAFALLAFTTDELAELPRERRLLLDVLLKRQLRHSLDPSVADALRVRRQFEDFCESQSSQATCLRLFPVLRR